MPNPFPAGEKPVFLGKTAASLAKTELDRMKAAYFNECAGFDRLKLGDLAQPKPGRGEVVVEVHATAITLAELDWFPTFHTPKREPRPFPIIPCHEFSGVVAALGEDAAGFTIGDPVYGMNDWFSNGALAEFCTAPATAVARKPQRLDHEQAAVVPISALTAWQGLFQHGKMRAGEHVLIHGGSGAVGLFAVQLARWRGAHVVATASAANLDFVRELGAEEVIDYRAARFESAVQDIDLVFDTVGGETLSRSSAVLKPGGRIVTVATQSKGSGEKRGNGIFFIVEPNRTQLDEVARLLDERTVRAFVEAVFPLADARDAFARAARGGRRGKVVVQVKVPPEQSAPPAPRAGPVESHAEDAPVAETPKPAVETMPKRRPWRRILGGLAILLVLIFGIPRVIHALRTVSTDDAYVNSHVTFVAPRVAGQVTSVLVDDNNQVKTGDVLVELDPEPYQVQLAIKQSQLDKARAALVEARATARSKVGQARSLRFKLQNAIEDVDNQIAILNERAERLNEAKATLALAQVEFDRANKLLATKVISQDEFDKNRKEFEVARAQCAQALDSVYQQRVALGLSRQPPAGKPLTDVPSGLDQQFSGVLEALFALLGSAGQLGIVPSSYDLTPSQVLAEFYKRDPSGNLDRILAEVLKTAPAIKEAEAGVKVAERDLDQARLDLSYCTIVAEIDGVVTRRNVNPGDHVQVGQGLMAIRSLHEIWVDANFKETQLKYLRIGQPVELKVDMYGSRRTFEGRISGFTMGTGSTLSLLPAQNATGNYVKVVQRLPVRIEILHYDPKKAPLFVGLSVEPSVYINGKPTGPNAGRYLQELITYPAAKP